MIRISLKMAQFSEEGKKNVSHHQMKNGWIRTGPQKIEIIGFEDSYYEYIRRLKGNREHKST